MRQTYLSGTITDSLFFVSLEAFYNPKSVGSSRSNLRGNLDSVKQSLNHRISVRLQPDADVFIYPA